MSKRGGGAIRIVVAATSAVRRAGLESVIRSEPEFQLAGSTGAMSRVEIQTRQSNADVILIDCDTLPDKLFDHSSMYPMVVLSDVSAARAVSRLLHAGVRAILPRESDPEDIV